MDRRTFLKKTSTIALAAPVCLQACLNKPAFPILDTHQHLWDLDRFPLKWVSPPLDKNFLMSDYQLAIKGTRIEKAIYMEVAVPEEFREEEAQWALGLCEDNDNPTEGAVICANPTTQEFEPYIKSFEGNPFLKGIRYFFSNKEQMVQPQLINNIKLLGELGLSFDLNIAPEWLKTGKSLVDRCPKTQFILNHCGNADPIAFMGADNVPKRKPKHDAEQWINDMSDIGQRGNIVCKISGIVNKLPDTQAATRDLSPIVNYCFEAFSLDKVIFASDWPVCLRKTSLSHWVEILKEIVSGYSPTEQKKLFYDNAFKLYKL